MAKPEVKNVTDEVVADEVKAPAKKEVAEVKEDVNYADETEEERLTRLSKETDEAYDAGNRFKAFTKILEAHTGYSYSQREVKDMLEAFQDFVILTTYFEGSLRLRRLGNFNLIDVAARSGKIKTQGVEKEWTSPEHTTIKFYANDTLKAIVTTPEESYKDMLKELFIDNILEPEAEEDEEAAE